MRSVGDILTPRIEAGWGEERVEDKEGNCMKGERRVQSKPGM